MRSITTELEGVLPEYDFVEHHRRRIRATPAAVYDAFKALTLGEMGIAALLFAIRSLPARFSGRPGLPSRSEQPVLDQFLDLGFGILGDVPGREIVVGHIGRMWRFRGPVLRITSPDAFVAFDEPGFVKVAMTFLVSATGDATLAETETRVLATDDLARRGFRRYWLVIRPFSGLIRRIWLRAVARRAGRTSRPVPLVLTLGG